MKPRQRSILTAGAVMFALLGLFPPWVHTLETRFGKAEEPAGYGFILAPPEAKGAGPSVEVRVDTARLLVRWVVVVGATGLALFLTRRDDSG
jgi:hypothetical protein